jgi:anti-repressor protein
MNSQGSNAIQAFVFPETNQKVRVFVDKDGTLWFVATDVCRMLGYKGNVSRIIQLHCKIDGVTKRNTVDNLGKRQEVTVINESNLYRLINRSNAPNADPFQDWVCEEVLPSIRKTGSYGHKPQLEFDPNDLGHVRNVLAALSVQTIQDKATIEALEVKTAKITTRVIAAKAKIAEQQPLVEAYERLAASEGSLNITEAAKALGKQPKELTAYLMKNKWIFERPPAKRKIVYQTKINAGLMESSEKLIILADGREFTRFQPMITVAGLARLALHFGVKV